MADAGPALGLKGMLYAAKAMALAAFDFARDPARVARTRAEFARATPATPYRQVVEELVAPPQVPADATGARVGGQGPTACGGSGATWPVASSPWPAPSGACGAWA